VVAVTHYDPEKYVLLQKGEPGAEPFTHPDAVVGKAVPIQVPIALVRGHLEKLTDDELYELQADVAAEATRREPENAEPAD
jgi:hypothetical protein